MAITTLDANTALVVIDLQNGILDTHTHSITRIFPELGETGTTTEIIDLLQERA